MNNINVSTGLNLCDIFYMENIEKVLSELKDKLQIERIYTGSYFCDNYFMRQDYNLVEKNVEKYIGKKVNTTLVIPVVSQKKLQDAKDKIRNLLTNNRLRIDEVTVNDYGMLTYIDKLISAEKYNTVINLGRLFFKDYRDPRYEEYFEENYYAKGINKYLCKIIDKYNVNEIEMDVTHRKFIFPKNNDCIIGIHTPFNYISTGRICEYASAFREYNDKFRSDIICGRECNKMCMEYGFDNNRKWIKIGRTIYYENNCFKIDFSENSNVLERLIYFPINELINKQK